MADTETQVWTRWEYQLTAQWNGVSGKAKFVRTANAAPTLLEHYRDIYNKIIARTNTIRVKPERDRLNAVSTELTVWYRDSISPSTLDPEKIKGDISQGGPLGLDPVRPIRGSASQFTVKL